MNDQEINKTIAEYCGWTECRLTIKGAGGGTRFETAYGKPPARKYEAPCPDYTGCLNAIHEAEKFLKGGIRNTYDANLIIISERDYCFVWEMSAKQKAEAFLRTLHKWEE